MLLLVSAIIQLIVGWEGVGAASYLLIGHYWEDKANSSAGMKAFYTNRVADIGLTIGTIVWGPPSAPSASRRSTPRQRRAQPP